MLRKAKSDEYRKIRELAEAGGVFPYPHWFYRLLIAMSCVFLITKGGKKDEAVGYVSFIPIPLVYSVFILQVSITPEYQGKHLGSTALEVLFRLLKRKLRIKRIYLHTLKVKAYKWFSKRKFRTLASIPSKVWILYKTYRQKRRDRRNQRFGGKKSGMG